MTMEERIEAAERALCEDKFGPSDDGTVSSFEHDVMLVLRSAVPELFDGNHKIVPLEATEDMWLASIKITPLKEPEKAPAKRSYRDMVAAAP